MKRQRVSQTDREWRDRETRTERQTKEQRDMFRWRDRDAEVEIYRD
jgi:hypothetical protein